jgi:iron complex outermembrane recepter protein
MTVLGAIAIQEVAAAQSPPGAPPPVPKDMAPESAIVITGERDPDIAPLMQFDPPDLDSYKADSLRELLDALQPRIHSGMSNEAPVVLINGRRAGPTELQNLPREAVLRVDVLPEKEALRYGFPDNRRVVNFVLREHYRGAIASLSDSQATEGEGQKGEAQATLIRVEHESQATVKADYTDSARLLESDRGISATDADYRTLLPAQSEARLGGTFTHPFFGLQPSIEASVDLKSSDSLQGLAAPGTDTPAPGPDDTVLRQHTSSTATHFATRVSGFAGDLTWTASATYNGNIAHTLGGTGVGPTGAVLINHTDASADRTAVEGTLGGRLATLPAGSVAISVNAAAQEQDSRAQTQLSGAPATISHLSRTTDRIAVNANIPLTSREAAVLPFLGDVASRFHAGAQEVSSFGLLTSLGGGMTWKPIKNVTFGADFVTFQQAPSVQALLAPIVETPGVQMFDFVEDETVYVTQIAGGNESLRASDNRLTTFGVSVGPFKNQDGFSAYFERRRVSDAVGTLPPVTSAVEEAFPDRFIRDPDGMLIEVDDRSVNLALTERDDLTWGFYALIPLSPSASAPSSATTSASKAPNASEPHGPQLRLSLYDTWYFRDTILFRDGIPELDLLNGAPSASIAGNSVAGTQPRHALDLHTDLIIDGAFLAQLRTRWTSPTEVVSGTQAAADILHFSALTTMDMGLLADLGKMPATKSHSWAQGMRVSLAINNLLNTHQKVRDSTGATPTGFEPGYVDPLGRLLTLSVRKTF